ncbi:MAG TPA: hypothetical protein VMF31_12210 [Solirubrobacterales bacterium]|nr:hypothetical protein [Solirubrobacterales bacterium]
MFKKSFAAVPLAVLATVLLVACGGGGGDGDSEEELSKKREDAMLAFTECMRENGVDMPDPQPDGSMMMTTESGIDPNSQEFKDAQEACGQILEDARPEGAERMTEPPEEMLEYAECMRGEGVDFPDPDFDGGRVTMGPGPGGSVDEEAMKRADEACHDILPEGGFMRGGPAGEE